MAAHTTPTKATAATAFRTLQRVTGTSATHLATNVLKTSRTTVHSKLKGTTPLTFDDLDTLAEYFEVPVSLFFMDRPAILTWMASSGWSDQDGRAFGCIIELAEVA